MSHALSIQNLSCRYQQKQVVKDLALEVAQNEIMCLLGPSGCGKTTLLRAIAGLMPVEQGEVRINGQLVDGERVHVPAEQRHIGFIFQDYALFPHLTVAQNIAFGLHKLSKSEQQQRIDDALALINMPEIAERYPHQLSGGQQQRVAIARAMAYRPQLLLLDEPFSNIDAQVRHQLMAEIRAIIKSRGISAVFVTHAKEEAFAFADRLALFECGTIAQVGSAQELYQQPTSRYVASFLGGSNYLPCEVLDATSIKTPLGELRSVKPLTVAAGAVANLLLRPHHIQVQANANGELTVTDCQFQGGHCQVAVQMASQQLMALSNEPLAIGSKVSAQILPHELVLFNH